ncbi:MAG: hypothetical protein J6040_05180 [Clostridiales bacterium]|nr:hypothetical protein [Clostridiales bacterium]
MKQGKSLSSKAAGILTAAVLIASMAASCSQKKDPKDSVTSGSSQVAEAASDGGSGKEEIILENELSETQIWVSENTEETDNAEPTDAVLEDPAKEDPEEAAVVSVPSIEGRGRVLFTEEYNNFAWGKQTHIMAIYEDGSVFLIGDEYFKETGKLGEDGYDYLSVLLANLESLEKDGTDVKVEDDYLSRLLLLAEAIDPDASFSMKHARSDYGQKAVYYWTEDGTRVRCYEKGDNDYIIDDPDAELFGQMWEEITGHFEAIS